MRRHRWRRRFLSRQPAVLSHIHQAPPGRRADDRWIEIDLNVSLTRKLGGLGSQ